MVTLLLALLSPETALAADPPPALIASLVAGSVDPTVLVPDVGTADLATWWLGSDVDVVTLAAGESPASRGASLGGACWVYLAPAATGWEVAQGGACEEAVFEPVARHYRDVERVAGSDPVVPADTTARCVAEVTVDAAGLPVAIDVSALGGEGCGAPEVERITSAMAAWQWAPARTFEGHPTPFTTRYAFTWPAPPPPPPAAVVAGTSSQAAPAPAPSASVPSARDRQVMALAASEVPIDDVLAGMARTRPTEIRLAACAAAGRSEPDARLSKALLAIALDEGDVAAVRMAAVLALDTRYPQVRQLGVGLPDFNALSNRAQEQKVERSGASARAVGGWFLGDIVGAGLVLTVLPSQSPELIGVVALAGVTAGGITGATLSAPEGRRRAVGLAAAVPMAVGAGLIAAGAVADAPGAVSAGLLVDLFVPPISVGVAASGTAVGGTGTSSPSPSPVPQLRFAPMSGGGRHGLVLSGRL